MLAKPKFSPQARTAARQRALQALYQWQLTDQSIQLIESQFLTEQNMLKVDISYFQKLIHEVPQQVHFLDVTLLPFLDRQINQLDPIEQAILRIGCYELNFCQEIPFKVIINEAVELAKKFGAEKSHKYVNSILDKVAHRLRQTRSFSELNRTHT